MIPVPGTSTPSRPLQCGSISRTSFLLQQTQSDQAVGLSPLQQCVEAWDLIGAGGDDDFAADFVRQVVVAAKFHHGGGALDAKLCFQRSRLVVNAGVNHAAVVSALVAGNTVLLLDQQQAQVRDRRVECIAVERPTIPPPMTTMSKV